MSGKIKHGHNRKFTGKSPTYSCWDSMKQRCRNPKHIAYRYYGGRGIKVCDRWNQFENFLADMGERPSARHSLDRYPDTDGHYEPGNVRWTTKREQALNRNSGNLRLYEYHGKTQTLAEWAREYGFVRETLDARLRQMSIAQALEKPIRARASKNHILGL